MLTAKAFVIILSFKARMSAALVSASVGLKSQEEIVKGKRVGGTNNGFSGSCFYKL